MLIERLAYFLSVSQHAGPWGRLVAQCRLLWLWGGHSAQIAGQLILAADGFSQASAGACQARKPACGPGEAA
ncbi:hypothetical protein SBA4_7030001 [Candidatus Sulfopaludibacter sp. SbA4]|nr:hypothetical protein SBA4_7030001 [Candidatus Sulfopaludibacter sp. SbA4]